MFLVHPVDFLLSSLLSDLLVIARFCWILFLLTPVTRALPDHGALFVQRK